MKIKCLFLAGCLSLIVSTVSFAWCGDAGYGCSSCGEGYCNENETVCQCTDPNCGKNPCLSRSDCCDAFGNVGGR